jgi:hypothetical protein
MFLRAASSERGCVVHRVAGAVDGLRIQGAVDVRGDVGAGVVDHHQHVVALVEPVLENRHQIRQFGHPDDRLGGRPVQVLVEHDAGGAGHHRAPAAPDRRAQVHDRPPDLGGDGFVGALALQLLAQRAPLEIELRGGVLGVVRVVEVDRCEGPGTVQ